MYEKQKIWTDGNSIEVINENLKKIVNDLKINNFNFDKCLNDKISEKLILEGRVKAQKKYKIDSTPQIIINKKKYNGPTDFINIAKKIKKLI
jgi:protein-disulfide isomerase